MSAFWKGNSNSKNQPHWRASAARLRLQKIEVTDLKLNTKTVYDSINAAAKALNIDAGIISKYFSLTKWGAPPGFANKKNLIKEYIYLIKYISKGCSFSSFREIIISTRCWKVTVFSASCYPQRDPDPNYVTGFSCSPPWVQEDQVERPDSIESGRETGWGGDYVRLHSWLQLLNVRLIN